MDENDIQSGGSEIPKKRLFLGDLVDMYKNFKDYKYGLSSSIKNLTSATLQNLSFKEWVKKEDFETEGIRITFEEGLKPVKFKSNNNLNDSRSLILSVTQAQAILEFFGYNKNSVYNLTSSAQSSLTRNMLSITAYNGDNKINDLEIRYISDEYNTPTDMSGFTQGFSEELTQVKDPTLLITNIATLWSGLEM